MSLLFFICQNLAGGVFADCNLIVIEYKLYTKTLDSYSSTILVWHCQVSKLIKSCLDLRNLADYRSMAKQQFV